MANTTVTPPKMRSASVNRTGSGGGGSLLVRNNVVGKAFNRATGVLSAGSSLNFFSFILGGLGSLIGGLNQTKAGVVTRPVSNVLTAPARFLGRTPGAIIGNGGLNASGEEVQSLTSDLADWAETKMGTGTANAIRNGQNQVSRFAEVATTHLGSVANKAGKLLNWEKSALKDMEFQFRRIEKIRNKAAELGANSGILANLTDAAEALKNNQSNARDLYDAALNGLDALDGKGKDLKALRRYAREIGLGFETHNKLEFAKDPKGNLSNYLANQSTGQILADVAQGAMRARQLYHGVKTGADGISCIRQMTQDLTGKRPSFWAVVFNRNLPPLAVEARKHYFRHVLPGSILQIASVPLESMINRTVQRHIGSNLGRVVTTMATFQAIDVASNYLASKNTFLPVYHHLHALEHKNQTIAATDYLNLIVAASPAFENKGGVYSIEAQLVAMSYAEAQAPVSQVLKDAQQGMPHLLSIAEEAKLKYAKHLTPQAETSVASAGQQTDMVQEARESNWVGRTGGPKPSGQDVKFTDLVNSKGAAAGAFMGA